MIKKITITILIGLISACSTVSPGGYYWGKYEYTSHSLIKNPSVETKAAHEATLRDIISESKSRSLRVPPGIHGELGHLLAKENRNSEALSQYEAELKLYPESKVFLEKLLQIESEKGSNDEK